MVCRAWRHLAINAPLLWQQLQLFVESLSADSVARNNVQDIVQALQLTHGVALDITVNITLVSAHVRLLPVKLVLTAFAKYLAPYMGQLRALIINSNDARISQCLWHAFAMVAGTTSAPQFDNLRRISCQFSGNESQEKTHSTFLDEPQYVHRSSWYIAPRLTVLDAPCGMFALGPGSLGDLNLTHITIGISNVNEIAEVINCPTIRTARLLLRYYDFVREVPAQFELPRRAHELESLHFDQLPWEMETCAEDGDYDDDELERTAEHRQLVWRVLVWPHAARVHQLTYDELSSPLPDLGFSLFSSLGEKTSLALIISWGTTISITVVEIEDANSFTVPFDSMPGRRHSITFDGETGYIYVNRLWSKLRVNRVSLLCIDIPEGWEVQWGELPVYNLKPLQSATRFIAITKRREDLVASLEPSELEDWQEILPAVESLSFLEHDNHRRDEEWEFASWVQASTTLEHACDS